MKVTASMWACWIGMRRDALSAAAALPSELAARVLALVRTGDYQAVCEAAEAWECER